MNGEGRGRHELPPGVIAAARLAHLAFFLLTAAYCLLTYNAFAYRQFIKPHLVVWLTDFVIWHHAWYWLLLGVTTLTLWPELTRRDRGHVVGAGYLGAAVAIGIALGVRPVLPQVENDWRGLALALAALVPPLWLAWFDHRHAGRRWTTASASLNDARLVRACLVTGLLVWGVETFEAPWLLTRTGEIALTLPRLAFGATVSLAAHALAFSAMAAIAIGTLHVVRRVGGRGRFEYWAVVGLVILTLTAGIAHVVFGGLAFTGVTAWTVAFCVATTLAITWSGIALRLASGRRSCEGHQASPVSHRSAIDVWLGPLPGTATPAWSATAVAVLVAASALSMKAVEPIDWDFLFQKVCVLGFWGLTLAYALAALPASAAGRGWPGLATGPLVGAMLLLAAPRLPAWAGEPRWVPEFVIEGYVAVAPSFHLLHDVLRLETATDAAFFRELRENSTLQHADVQPVSVDFVPVPARSGAEGAHGHVESPPHIFLFVVDSLRRDYLSAYNPAVWFTPAFGAFARDSVVFDRAFTRYGGTGLSVPAIWSGGMLFHKQYVTPFAPMNALMKLLDAAAYRRVMSMDSVVAQLLPADTPTVELDRDVPIVDYDLCRTLAELRSILALEDSGARPIFMYTLPQNLHIAQVRSKPVPPGRTYPGFFAPAAAEVERMDACFGAFIDDLRRRRLYDQSIIVVTADHGDSLGEARRWGHSYTMFPEIVRVPLMVHVPERLRSRFRANPEALALSTDLTPSLYALLGYRPADLGPLFGRSLFRPVADFSDDAAWLDRPALLASSYGAVYAVVRDYGQRLYIADGVNNREYAYDLSEAVPVRIGVTERARSGNRAFIRAELERLARLYHFDREP